MLLDKGGSLEEIVKEKALNSLVGAVMKKMKGRADARAAREILLGKLE